MKIGILNITIFLLASITCKGLFAQTNSEKINLFLYNKISKNVYAFNLRNASAALNGVLTSNVLDGAPLEFYSGILPGMNQTLIIDIDSVNIKYPVNNYKMFKAYIHGFRFLDTIANKISKMLGVGLLTEDFLVAIDTSMEYPRIKFISGQFYPSRISHDFNANYRNPLSWIKYLELRMFNYHVKQIEFYCENEKGLMFNGYSEVEKSKVQIFLPKDDIERPFIIKESDSNEGSIRY